MHTDYLTMIEIINKNISKFNEFLSLSKQIPQIELSQANDNNIFTKLVETSWLDLRFPNADKRGIYLVFGQDTKDKSKKALYIGKASYSSSIGKRLYAHLKKDKQNEHYTMYDLNENLYILEYLYGLNLESLGLEMLSSALEEFLISNIRGEITLLNGIGNSNINS